MAIVPDNLGRLSLISQQSSRRADRLSGERQADKAQMHQSLQNLGSTLQRGRLASQAEEGMMERQLVGQEFAAGEAGLERGFRTGEREGVQEFETGVIKQARANFEDGSYYDTQTKKNYEWDTPEQFEAAMRQLEGDRQRNYLQLQAYLRDNKDEDAQNKLLTAFDDIVNRTFGDPSINPDPNNPLTFGQMEKEKAIETFNRYMTSADFAWLSPEDQTWMVETFQSWLTDAEEAEEEEAGSSGKTGFFQGWLNNLAGGAHQIVSAVGGISPFREGSQVRESGKFFGPTVFPTETEIPKVPDFTPNLPGEISADIPVEAQGQFAAGQALGQLANTIRTGIATAQSSVLKGDSDAQQNAFSLLKALNVNALPDAVKNDPGQMEKLAGYVRDISDGEFSDSVMNNFLRLIGRSGTATGGL